MASLSPSLQELVVGHIYRLKVATEPGWSAVLTETATPTFSSAGCPSPIFFQSAVGASPAAILPSTPFSASRAKNSQHWALVVEKSDLGTGFTVVLFTSFGDKPLEDVTLPPNIPDLTTLRRLLLRSSETTPTFSVEASRRMLDITPPFLSPPSHSYLILIPLFVAASDVVGNKILEKGSVSSSELERVRQLLKELRSQEPRQSPVPSTGEEPSDDGLDEVTPDNHQTPLGTRSSGVPDAPGQLRISTNVDHVWGVYGRRRPYVDVSFVDDHDTDAEVGNTWEAIIALSATRYLLVT